MANLTINDVDFTAVEAITQSPSTLKYLSHSYVLGGIIKELIGMGVDPGQLAGAIDNMIQTALQGNKVYDG